MEEKINNDQLVLLSTPVQIKQPKLTVFEMHHLLKNMKTVLNCIKHKDEKDTDITIWSIIYHL